MPKRCLNEIELEEAEKVFANKIDLNRVRILEHSKFAKMGKIFAGKTKLGVSLVYTIHFTQEINCKPGNWDMAWLIHELTHVWQYEIMGLLYIPRALYAQHFTKGKYNYGGHKNIINKRLSEFNLEQQAEIVKDFYLNLGSKKLHPIYAKVVENAIHGVKS
jgi:hypothetical protein